VLGSGASVWRSEEKEMLFEIPTGASSTAWSRLAEQVAEAREAYKSGDVCRGTVDDLLDDLGE
ncbi:MAG: hypothetical protein U5K43_10700, partial [Halofilum sp. (in: g-proteobacteria)]|nr:hypothetical protein [Halofilum sp. (in: g-proteobacteria)]